MTAHWGIADPAALVGTDEQKRHAFFSAFRELSQRIRIFTSLPIRSLDQIKLQERLNAIGKTTSTDEVA
jgi:arsenate reductase